MRIAVTYENGMVFQHFGHSEQFKVYDVEDGNARLREEYTLYSKALGEHDGAVEYKVKPSQVRQSVLDRMAPSKETEKGG